MQIVIDIPEEQIKKSLEESKYIHEDEGEKGSVNIVMLYTNGRLDFVDMSRKTDFYSCEYKILPKGHGTLKDVDNIKTAFPSGEYVRTESVRATIDHEETIIEADKAESEDKE
jgi:hypothetical protein